MTDSEFWNLIERARSKSGDGPDDFNNGLFQILSEEPPQTIVAFNDLFMSKVEAAYRWDLWGAAYFINGGCSDDGFEYFRAWLVSRGKLDYEAALSNPDSLADVISPGDVCESEETLCVAWKAYKKVTGSEIPPRIGKQPREPQGNDWDFDDKEEMARRFPQLSELLD